MKERDLELLKLTTLNKELVNTQEQSDLDVKSKSEIIENQTSELVSINK